MMKADHFDDSRISAVMAGAALTPDERDFLVRDTPTFEEGMSLTEGELRQMSDKDLMRIAYNVWADYASGQV
jgi:hypothetical protein